MTTVDWMGLHLQVTADTTPSLGTEAAVRGIQNITPPGPWALDVGCGQGAIAIALAQKPTILHVHALDRQPGLRKLVGTNSTLNSVGHKVSYTPLDLYDATHRRLQTPKAVKYDVIALNPPQRPVPPHTHRFDHNKQYHAGDDGLDFTRDALQYALPRLADDGIILIQLLDWHAGREQKIFEKHNIRSRILPDSIIPVDITTLLHLNLQDFTHYQQKGIPYQFRDRHDCKATPLEAQTLLDEGQAVSTTFKLHQLQKK